MIQPTEGQIERIARNLHKANCTNKSDCTVKASDQQARYVLSLLLPAVVVLQYFEKHGLVEESREIINDVLDALKKEGIIP